jgi:hypothetical protein
MLNFTMLTSEHVHINSSKIEECATELATSVHWQIADWREILPPGLELKEQVDYIVGLISIDFCHWGLKEHPEKGIWNFYVETAPGTQARGSAAMTALAKKAYGQGIKLFNAPFMAKANPSDLRPLFIGKDDHGNLTEIPWLEKRVQVLNEVGQILLQKWNGSFYNLFLAAEGSVVKFIELLVRDFPRFQDEYFYKGQKIGIYKLAQLAAMALQSAIDSDLIFSDLEALTLCADYQLPRGLRALGILEYGPQLMSDVDQEKLIEPGSSMEIELRMATVFAGEKLKQAINAHLMDQGRPRITSQELDYWLWSYGRQLDRTVSKHHLTCTIMY